VGSTCQPPISSRPGPHVRGRLPRAGHARRGRQLPLATLFLPGSKHSRLNPPSQPHSASPLWQLHRSAVRTPPPAPWVPDPGKPLPPAPMRPRALMRAFSLPRRASLPAIATTQEWCHPRPVCWTRCSSEPPRTNAGAKSERIGIERAFGAAKNVAAALLVFSHCLNRQGIQDRAS
jgi:hypothetical protein